MQKRALYPVIVGLFGPGPRHDHHVQTTIEHLLAQPIIFPDQSLDPVSDDAVPHLLADRYSDSVLFPVISTHIKDKDTVRIRFPGAVAFSEIIVFLQRFYSHITLNKTKKATFLRLSGCLSNG